MYSGASFCGNSAISSRGGELTARCCGSPSAASFAGGLRHRLARAGPWEGSGTRRREGRASAGSAAAGAPPRLAQAPPELGDSGQKCPWKPAGEPSPYSCGCRMLILQTLYETKRWCQQGDLINLQCSTGASDVPWDLTGVLLPVHPPRGFLQPAEAPSSSCSWPGPELSRGISRCLIAADRSCQLDCRLQGPMPRAAVSFCGISR
ncbi:uncharacterized protein LOC141932262 [Strix aluco]|uniref:uncharacterized protein LOC141932262 n=1 Tax=Strix aluco TaxID=111821 RepID=UPI003DA4959F